MGGVTIFSTNLFQLLSVCGKARLPKMLGVCVEHFNASKVNSEIFTWTLNLMLLVLPLSNRCDWHGESTKDKYCKLYNSIRLVC